MGTQRPDGNSRIPCSLSSIIWKNCKYVQGQGQCEDYGREHGETNWLSVFSQNRVPWMGKGVPSPWRNRHMRRSRENTPGLMAGVLGSTVGMVTKELRVTLGQLKLSLWWGWASLSTK